jgi:hypothetical protein
MIQGKRNIIASTVSFGENASIGDDNEIRGDIFLNINISNGLFIASESGMILNPDTVVKDMRNPHDIVMIKLSEVIENDDLLIAHAAQKSSDSDYEQDVIYVFKNTEYKQDKLGYKVLETA